MNAVTLVLFAMMALQASAMSGSPPTVQYADGRLTADLQDADAADVVAQLALEAGLFVQGTPTPQRISIQLDAVPLADAIFRLLKAQSFALTYDGSGAPKGIRFLGSSTAAPSPATAGQPPAPLDIDESGSLAERHGLFPVGGRLAAALGADQVPFEYIVGVAMQSGDAGLRRDALRVGLRLIHSDPELRAEVLQALDGLDDAALTRWLTEAAGKNAEEVARGTARSSRLKLLRTRAAAVRQRLSGTVDPGRGGG